MLAEVLRWALIFQLISSLLLLSTSPTTGYLYRFCTKDNYTVNSPFARNLKKLLQSLPTTSLTGSNHTVSDPDIFGQTLCRGDASPSDYKSCLQKATEEILIQCGTTEAIIWFDLCQVHYSSTRFFSSMTYTGKYPAYNKQMEKTTLPAKFDVVLDALFSELSNEAAHDPSRQRFAAGKAEASSKTIYALVQCTTDISSEDCFTCLEEALGDLKGCCYPHQGGMVLSRSCDIRFGLKRFYNASAINEIFLPRHGGNKTKEALEAAGTVAAMLVVIILSFLFYRRKRKQALEDEEKNRTAVACAFSIPKGVALTKEGTLVCTDELPFMDLATIKAATADFSDSNKLGQGGFGSIYRGTLPDGKQIAAKRLSRMSWQGFEEFKNEIILIAKLQHTNLVRLLGCGFQGEEKILVYEFMPNRSLDLYIFDPEKRAKMNWETRYSIIDGVARGLLYLHQDSRLRIIHRDLKPSNILLDDEMVAKVSDFGLARIFTGEKNTVINTKRVVGTYGYMAPEYAMEGLFSIKSDVFSFGVILLEIIIGKKNSGFHLTLQAQTLLAYAWSLWNEERIMDFVDSLLPDPYHKEEVIKCIHIGLLCVQEDPADRPTMSSVVSQLSNESPILRIPNRPAVPVGKLVNHQNLSNTGSCLDDVSEYSVISPR